MKTVPIIKQEVTNGGEQPCKNVFPASHLKKEPWVCRGGNSKEYAEGQVNSEQGGEGKKKVEK